MNCISVGVNTWWEGFVHSYTEHVPWWMGWVLWKLCPWDSYKMILVPLWSLGFLSQGSFRTLLWVLVPLCLSYQEGVQRLLGCMLCWPVCTNSNYPDSLPVLCPSELTGYRCGLKILWVSPCWVWLIRVVSSFHLLD